MSHPNFSVVISSFSNKKDIFLEPLKNSIYKYYPNVDIKVYGKKEDKEIKLIDQIKEKSEFSRISPGSLKIIFWNKGLFEAQSEWVLFVDADTLMLNPIDYLFEFCRRNKVDFLFSWRDSNIQFVNTGVMLVKKNKDTLSFFSKYKNGVIKDVLNWENDQNTFMKLLMGNKIFKSIKFSQNKNKKFVFNQENINFGSIHCEIMNNANPKRKLSDKTIIQHYKGVLGTIIMKNKKENRYENFLAHGIYKYSMEEIKNIDYKIKIWKNFSSLDPLYLDFPLDVYKFYNKNKYKRIYIFTLESIKNLIKNKLRALSNFCQLMNNFFN